MASFSLSLETAFLAVLTEDGDFSPEELIQRYK